MTTPSARATSLVGRRSELAVLDRLLTGAGQRQGGTVFLVGEAGIGKTRLALEAAARAQAAGMQVLRGRGSPLGPAIPFRPLTEALLSLSRGGLLPADGALGPYQAVLGRLVPDWAHLVTPQTDSSLVVLAEAVLRLVSGIPRAAGCLLVLDDLQDSDAETLAVAEYLADNLDGQPVVLLATVREERSDALDLARRLARRDTAVVVDLARLEPAGLATMVAESLDCAATDLPAGLLDELWESSAGVPFVVEELLHAMTTNGWLARTATGWRVVGGVRSEMPESLLRHVATRTERLGEQGRQLLSVAALLGRRFPLSIVQQVTGLDDRDLLAHLRAGMAAHLVGPDDTAPDWYAFRHPLVAEGLLADLMPGERAALSLRAADAVERAYPGLPGEWCAVVAALRQGAGDPRRAGELLTEAGRRAFVDGAANSAVLLLERAQRLLAGPADLDARADALEALLPALAEAGRFERATELADSLDAGGSGLSPRRRAALRSRLARVAGLNGRWQDGAAALRAARELLGAAATDRERAGMDAIGALLALGSPGSHQREEAERLARRALAVTATVSLPDIAFDAWQAMGLVARPRDPAESDGYFEQARVVAEEHHLPAARVYAMTRLGTNRWLADGDTAELVRARDDARRLGMVVMVHSITATLVLDAVLRGDLDTAVETGLSCLEEVSRLRLAAIRRHLLTTLSSAAGHRGDRTRMEETLTEFHELGGAKSAEQPLVLGLAEAFCALLEEDPDRARDALEEAARMQSENPNVYQLSGSHGLAPLMAVLHGTLDDAGLAGVSAEGPSQMRWNRQFAELAAAVAAGRVGRTADAAAAWARARAASQIYPLARHIGVRLVAEHAQRDGWADCVEALREAEAWFHDRQATAVASACRALLRGAGAPVMQRRDGAGRMPRALRALGVTVREYEILEVLVDPHLTNKAIGERLHISPRTVEKHVANLILKTGQADRASLSRNALRLTTDT